MPETAEDTCTETSRKPLSFWLSFVALNITVFIVSLDSTALAVAVPVCPRLRNSHRHIRLKLTTESYLENYTRPPRYNPRGILDKSVFYSRRRYNPAHLHHYIQCCRSQDPALRRVPLVLCRLHRLCCRQQYASLDHGPCVAGSRRRWVGRFE